MYIVHTTTVKTLQTDVKWNCIYKNTGIWNSNKMCDLMLKNFARLILFVDAKTVAACTMATIDKKKDWRFDHTFLSF